MKKQATAAPASELGGLIDRLLSVHPEMTQEDLSVKMGYAPRRLTEERSKEVMGKPVSKRMVKQLRSNLSGQGPGLLVKAKEEDLLKMLHGKMIGLEAGLRVLMEELAELKVESKKALSKKAELQALSLRMTAEAERLLNVRDT
jgi:hypothetical protein